MSTFETTHERSDADEQRDIKVPGKLNDAKAGDKVAMALRKWAKRVDGTAADRD